MIGRWCSSLSGLGVINSTLCGSETYGHMRKHRRMELDPQYEAMKTAFQDGQHANQQQRAAQPPPRKDYHLEGHRARQGPTKEPSPPRLSSRGR
eukprot:jgi/Chrzof1/4121/UNPLg00786.t1